jgi:hypothetical protein
LKWPFYDEARTVYDPFHARIVLLFIGFVIFIGFPMIWSAPGAHSAFSSSANSYEANTQDYTMVGVWLIIVPIGLLTLSWYHLRLKKSPWMRRRRMRLE